MRELVVNKNDENQRLDRFLIKNLPSLPTSLMFKYFRLKRIKVNGKRSKGDQRLALGDVVTLYINDEFFDKPDEDTAYLRVTPKLEIVYEDENLLLINKKPGLIVHSDENEVENTLISQIKAYLYQKKEWDPENENSFAPALCNRIDRNTGGIVIAAKNAETLRVLNQKIKDREIRKLYLCLVNGTFQPKMGRLDGFIKKNEDENLVTVTDRPIKGAKKASTIYRTICSNKGYSLLECELLTGRTHQIRAQLAHAGHPIVGDGKYGQTGGKKVLGFSHQALYSYKLIFSFTTSASNLDYLKDRSFTIKNVDFADDFIKNSGQNTNDCSP
ncbi:MAG: RluA family pseudouridine synthase [Clostridiales bacterium]|nr:RluA family pseudouridine synthase [Clostridiales bacterium]